MGNKESSGISFTAPTHVDAMVVKRQSQTLEGQNKLRLCWLLADGVTHAYRTDRERVIALAKWICGAVPHIYRLDHRGSPSQYKVHALDIITRGWGVCDATSEVMATLAWLAGYPSRRIAIWGEPDEKGKFLGHACSEVFLEGKWVFFDADLFRYFLLADGALANAGELLSRHDLVDEAEKERLKITWKDELAFLEDEELKFPNESGNLLYSLFFHDVYIEENTYSLDGRFGRLIKYTPKTREYLYGPPQYPAVKELLKGRLSFDYTVPMIDVEAIRSKEYLQF